MSISNVFRSPFIQVEEIQVLAYDGPQLDKTKLAPAMGFIARISASTRDGTLVGIGEARIAPARRDNAWQELHTFANTLQGARIKWRNDARSAIKETLMASLPQAELNTKLPRSLRPIEKALTHIAAQLGHVTNYRFTSLQEKRESEQWPHMVGRALDAAIDVDWLAAFPHVSEFAVSPPAPYPYGEGFNTYSEYRTPGAPIGLRTQDLFEITALSYGFSTRRAGKGLFLATIGHGTQTVGFAGPDSSGVSIAGISVSEDKVACKKLLSFNGIPVPTGFSCGADASNHAETRALELGFPLVVKPAYGKKGYGVSTGIDSLEGFRSAFKRAGQAGFSPHTVLVERELSGIDFRIIATSEKALCVIKRDRAHVVGNGRHSVGELIAWASTIRSKNPHLALRPFIPDVFQDLLHESGLRLGSVPERGTTVWLARSANLSQAGNSSAVIAETHPTIQHVAVEAVRACGLPYAGVDIILDDHRKPLDEQDAAIIEINTSPGMGSHRFPMYGQGIDLQAELFRHTAAEAGIDLPPRQSDLTVFVSVTGSAKKLSSYERLRDAAQELGVSGWVSTSEWPKKIDMLAHGAQWSVGMMLRLLFSRFSQSDPIEAQSKPVDSIPAPGFQLRH